MSLVVDTDVVSYLYKQDTRAELYRQHLVNPPFLLSFQTLAELRRWALERSWGQSRRETLENYLAQYLVVYADDDICNHWAAAMDSAKRNGQPIAAADAWIAAVALYYDLPLVTHNRNHFLGVDGLNIISESGS